MAGQQFFDVEAMSTLGQKGPSNVNRIAADGNGNLFQAIKGQSYIPISSTPPLYIPPWPGNPLFMLESWDIDGFGNQAPSALRYLVPTAADAVVAASHTWTFANGNFTSRDVGGTLTVSGATNANNNGTRTIISVTNGTTIVTDGTQTNETFATVANMTVVVTDTQVSNGAPICAAVNKGAQTNAGALVSWIRRGGQFTVGAPVSGREGNLQSIRTDGVGWLESTPAVPALAQPMTVLMVFSIDSIATTGGALFDALGATRAWCTITAGTGIVNLGSAGGAVSTGLAINSSQYQTLLCQFNGASSFIRLNGIQSGNINPTMGTGITGMTIGSLITGIQPMPPGSILCCGCWTDGTALTQIEAACAAIVGANPQ